MLRGVPCAVCYSTLFAYAAEVESCFLWIRMAPRRLGRHPVMYFVFYASEGSNTESPNKRAIPRRLWRRCEDNIKMDLREIG
jgi:hypothetical protein